MYLILKRFTAKEEENKKVWQAKLEGKDGRTGFKISTTVEAPDKVVHETEDAILAELSYADSTRN